MLRFKNVSKYYYNKGVIAEGFSKINIEFKLGEFVAIIGESGSGKSTLLNVISGLDSYEDGEMYINGEETSHYREVDFEEYRKKYVSNIFQSFNLVNSYTVYQNIELVLLLNGYNKSEVKDRVLELINKVNLNKYKNTKVSKLSGGQKQRVAIARALARDTPIIACDEPTASLDSKAAHEVIKLLKDISKDKLVIVVTHNFSEVEDVATRVVKMHDGKIISDKTIEEPLIKDELVNHESKSIKPINILRLGLRNTFNILPKFLLVFIVFLFITISLLSVYASFKKSEYEDSKMGSNYFFGNISDTRIIIKKKDKTSFTEDEFNNISKLSNVKNVIKYDITLDDVATFETTGDNSLYITALLKDIKEYNINLDYGRMPENDSEVILLTKRENYFDGGIQDYLNKIYYYLGDSLNFSIKLVGIKLYDSDDSFAAGLDTVGADSIIYCSDYIQNAYMREINRIHSELKLNINGKNYDSSIGATYDVFPSDKVPVGCAYVSEYMNYVCKNYNCKKQSLTVNVNNLYYTDKMNLKICNIYTSKNFSKTLGLKSDNYRNGSVFMNTNDYDKLLIKDSYQASVMVDHVDNIDSLSLELENLGYETLQIRKTLVNDGEEAQKILKIIRLVVIILLVVTLFFISYFVIKLIFKSRNVYYSTLRILGANFKHIKKILDIELFVSSSLAYLFYIGLIVLVKQKIIYFKSLSDIIEYLKLSDYIIMYIILIVMSYLISTRYARKIFKKSAMKTYREEV